MTTYGLIGYPLVHSFSHKFFTEKFAKEGIDAEYLNFEIPSLDDFLQLIADHPTLQGLNVTIPYKEKVMAYLDELDPEATAIGAVNVISVSRNNGKVKLKGFNADVIGFVRSIQPLLKPHHKKALILGTGGASKAIGYGLHKLGLQTTLVSRRPINDKMLSYGQLNKDVMQQYTVIVNCSPVGTFPNVNACPDIPYGSLGEEHLLYDLVYNPDRTLFLQKGEQQGAQIKNGLEMLHLQALAGWDIWQRH